MTVSGRSGASPCPVRALQEHKQPASPLVTNPACDPTTPATPVALRQPHRSANRLRPLEMASEQTSLPLAEATRSVHGPPHWVIPGRTGQKCHGVQKEQSPPYCRTSPSRLAAVSGLKESSHWYVPFKTAKTLQRREEGLAHRPRRGGQCARSSEGTRPPVTVNRSGTTLVQRSAVGSRLCFKAPRLCARLGDSVQRRM
jgi:hypothetical protein